MGTWYWIGVSAGVGAAWGIAGSSTQRRVSGVLFALCGGALLGVLLGLSRHSYWGDVTASAVGGVIAYLGAAVIVAGAFRRGGTRLGLAVLMIGIALVAAGIAFIPIAGYLEAVVVPTVAYRLRRLQPERYAGLRTLAKD